MRIARDPEPSARPCRGAAEQGLLLDDDHVETAEPRGDRSGETPAPEPTTSMSVMMAVTDRASLGGLGVARNSQ